MRKLKKKFKKPRMSWDSDLIKENKALTLEYGLKRKKEILISHEILRRFRERARLLIAEKNEEKEKVLMEKMARFGLLTDKNELDDVLALTIRDVLDRRLQTIVFKKGVVTSPKHARQMIVHGNIKIKGRKIKFPSYMVPVSEENSIEIVASKPRPKKQKPKVEDGSGETAEDAKHEEAAKTEESAEKPTEEAKPSEEKTEEKPVDKEEEEKTETKEEESKK